MLDVKLHAIEPYWDGVSGHLQHLTTEPVKYDPPKYDNLICMQLDSFIAHPNSSSGSFLCGPVMYDGGPRSGRVNLRSGKCKEILVGVGGTNFV